MPYKDKDRLLEALKLAQKEMQEMNVELEGYCGFSDEVMLEIEEAIAAYEKRLPYSQFSFPSGHS